MPRDRATSLADGRINRCSSVTELEGGGVDAVPQARRLRAVFEHMAQVGPAVGALDLGPPHEQAAIFLLLHVLFLDRRPETRPAGSGVEFRERGEEFLPADDAHVDPGLVVVPVFSRERPFGPFVDANVVLLLRELLPKPRFVEFLHEDTRALAWFKVLARHVRDDGHPYPRFDERCAFAQWSRNERASGIPFPPQSGSPGALPDKGHAARNACADWRKNMVEIVDISQGVVLLGLVALLTGLLVLLKGLYLIRAGEVGVLVKRLGGRKMPPGQVIARHGEIGTQAATLVPGLYWRMPVVWSMRRSHVLQVAENEIATVEAIDGRPLLNGRLLGDEVECNQFQDGEAFLDNGGFKGPQVAIIRPGTYRINPFLFNVAKQPATEVASGKVGGVTAQDGQPLPPKFIVAPPPEGAPSASHPSARSHNFFQDGQAFLDSGGFRGPQLDTLQPGRYYINPTLFQVQIDDVAEVPPGFVAVLRSNIGEELDQADIQPVPVTDSPDFDQTIHAAVERLLVPERNRRGIWRNPVAPGKYNLNRVAFTAYMVPTSAIMVDWARSERPDAPSLARRPAEPRADESDYPYLTEQGEKGLSFFRFGQLLVTSKDGFKLEVDVRMVIRILPENAAFVIARFGSVFNLIQQIVHPLIDASFRNNAGEKKALEFVQGRSQLQEEALNRARGQFAKDYVEAQNLLISYIDVDPSHR